MEENKKKVSVKKIIVTVVCVLLALLMAALIGVAVYISGLMDKIDRNIDSTLETISESEYEEMIREEEPSTPTDPVLEEVDPTDVVWEEETEIEKMDHIINILLIGHDRGNGEKSRGRSDAMILVTINKQDDSVMLTSLMRDTYVQIPGKKDNRLNASFAFGGVKLLNETIKKNYGITIDGNIMVDFHSFPKVIEVIGGIDMKLTKAEANHLNRLPYGDQGQWEPNLVAGMNRLDPYQALAYSRIRKLSGGDFGRTARQRKVLKAIFNEVKDMSLGQLNDLLDELLSIVSTDMEDSQILEYALDLLPRLSNLTISTQNIPVEGTYKNVKIGGKAVIVIDFEKNKEVLREFMSID